MFEESETDSCVSHGRDFVLDDNTLFLDSMTELGDLRREGYCTLDEAARWHNEVRTGLRDRVRNFLKWLTATKQKRAKDEKEEQMSHGGYWGTQYCNQRLCARRTAFYGTVKKVLISKHTNQPTFVQVKADGVSQKIVLECQDEPEALNRYASVASGIFIYLFSCS